MAIRRYLTLDIGASTLKIGEFTSASPGDLRLVNFGQATIQADPSDDADRGPQITAELSKLIRDRAFKERRVAVSVSSQVVLTRFMKLPAADEAKIRQMVRYEAAQNVPFPIEEVIWDYQPVGSTGQADLEVVLVAIKNDLIEGVNRSVEAAGLFVEVVDIAPLAIYNAARFNYAFEESEASRCTLMLDIGARTTNLIFIEPGKVYTRSIPVAGNTITQNIAQEFEVPFAEADELKRRQGFVGLGGAYEDPELESSARLGKIIRNVMTRLHAEAARSINFYKSQQGGKSPSRLLLCGGSSILPYTEHFFKEKMEIEVEYFNPFKNVPFEVPSDELEKTVHSMGEVVGLGLRLATECPVEVNLIPPSVTRRRQFAKKVPYFVVAMLGAIFMALGWTIYLQKVTRILSGYTEEVRKEAEQRAGIEAELKKAEEVAAREAVDAVQIQSVARARDFWLEFFDQLNALIPRDLWITQLTPANHGKAVSASGGAAAATAASPRRGPLRRGIIVEEIGPESAAPSPEAASGQGETKGITEFEIRGLCLNDRNSSEPLHPVVVFRDALARSGYFAEVKILEAANPQETDWSFSFLIRAKLKEPLLY
ncbi:MAG: type IV pilus assembly protein PilM [Verrucomicrobiae bacterium]|nr:type IV pilus assembly protein PilM [Verrucomicrobiae bacterium]